MKDFRNVERNKTKIQKRYSQQFEKKRKKKKKGICDCEWQKNYLTEQRRKKEALSSCYLPNIAKRTPKKDPEKKSRKEVPV